jgi:hypothetical protein
MLETLNNNHGKNKNLAPRQNMGDEEHKHHAFVPVILFLLVSACSLSPLGNSSGSGEGVTAVPLTTVPPVSGACSNPLYPVAATALRNYHVTGAPTGDFDYFTIIASVSESSFEEDSHFGELSKAVIWQCTPEGLAVLAPGGGVSGTIETPNASFEYTTTGSTGVTLPTIVAAGDTWTQTLSLHGEHTTSDGTVLTSDGTYTSFFTAVGMESVTVADGTYTAMRINVESNWNLKTTVSGITVPVHLNITSSVWYAPGIGMVKTTSVFGEITTRVELTGKSLPR